MMTNTSNQFRDKLKQPGYLSQLDVARIRKIAKDATDKEFQEYLFCEKHGALRILSFWEVAQVELWDAEILKRFFHEWIYEDRGMVTARIHAAQKAGRLPEHFTAEAGLHWLESENVLMGMIPHWVRANARRRETPTPEKVKPVQHSAAQDAAILAQITALGLVPQALPKNKPGKAGVKAAVRASLVGVSLLFPKKGTQFDHAWDRLRERRELADQA
jgi:hypothetical protein